MEEHGARCWLVNTGWTGGAFGTGSRICLAHTRAIVDAIHSGELSDAATPYAVMPVFGLRVPQRVSGVPDALLAPRASWPSAAAYDAQLAQLAGLFEANMHAFKDGAGYVSADVAAEILAAGPIVPAPAPAAAAETCVIAHKVASHTHLSDAVFGTSPTLKPVWSQLA